MPSRFHRLFERLPYWFIALCLIVAIFIWKTANDETYTGIFQSLLSGAGVTLYVCAIAFVLASALGFLICLARLSRFVLLRQCALFYIEVVRGLPMLIILYYIAFVGAPGLIDALNWLCGPLVRAGMMEELSLRNLDFLWRAVIALTVGYSAFLAEIFRAGIESVSSNFIEGAKSLGLNKWQVLRLVTLPLALRSVLPALGNEFIAILKDSALVSVLGVQDMTQLAKVYSASTFLFFETYNMLALLYLSLTLSLSFLVKLLEERMKKGWKN